MEGDLYGMSKHWPVLSSGGHRSWKYPATFNVKQDSVLRAREVTVDSKVNTTISTDQRPIILETCLQ